jgi:hypothetical protein
MRPLQVVDRKSGLLVCPISGRVSDRLVTAEEEEEEEGARDGGKGDDDGGGGCGSRLGDAFSAGYNCDNEQELQRTCGVRLSR